MRKKIKFQASGSFPKREVIIWKNEKVKVRLRPWQCREGHKPLLYWKECENETLATLRETQTTTCWEKLRSKPWNEPRGLRTITCRNVEVENSDWAEMVTPFLLKGWDLDNIERVSYHYEVVTLKISSESHTITHRRTTCDRQNLEEHFYKCESL